MAEGCLTVAGLDADTFDVSAGFREDVATLTGLDELEEELATLPEVALRTRSALLASAIPLRDDVPPCILVPVASRLDPAPRSLSMCEGP